ncbi:MAG: hypothetical protein AAFX44_06695 [Pseudomonadota bacterium]
MRGEFRADFQKLDSKLELVMQRVSQPQDLKGLWVAVLGTVGLLITIGTLAFAPMYALINENRSYIRGAYQAELDNVRWMGEVQERLRWLRQRSDDSVSNVNELYDSLSSDANEVNDEIRERVLFNGVDRGDYQELVKRLDRLEDRLEKSNGK